MPFIRSVLCQDNLLVFADGHGVTHSLTPALIPGADNTVALAEAWINGTWVPSVIDATAIQFVVHVFQLSPLRVTAWVARLGESLPANWWL